jgi:hypothetical protein
MDTLGVYDSDSDGSKTELHSTENPDRADASVSAHLSRTYQTHLPAPEIVSKDSSREVSTNMLLWSKDYLSPKLQDANTNADTPSANLHLTRSRLALAQRIDSVDTARYVDFLKKQRSFYSSEKLIAIATVTALSPIEDWETIDQLVLREEEARRRHQTSSF